MITYRLSAEDVARARFVVDPAWTVCSSFTVLVFPETRSTHRRLADALGKLELSDFDFLRTLASQPRHIPEVLTPQDAESVPGGADQAEARIRRAVRSVPDLAVESELDRLRTVDPRYRVYTVPLLHERIEEAVVGYWSTVLMPFWDMAQAISNQDLAKRAEDLQQHGLIQVANSLSRLITFTGATLEVDHPSQVDEPLHGGDLIFLPIVFHCPGGFILHGPDGTDRPGMPLCVAYPASGFGNLWEELGADRTSPFTRLLGTTRAQVLADTQQAATTTAIARRLGLPLGTVSSHLTVLADAGFLDRSRHGRYVYYQMSSAGRALAADRGGVTP